MPKRLKYTFEENIYPVWRVIFKKKIQEPIDPPVQFEMEIIETLPNGSITTVYRKVLTDDLSSQRTNKLSFAAFSLCLQDGQLIFSEIEREYNLIVETETQLYFAENSYLSGYLRVENASTVTNKAVLEVQGTLGISCEKLINRGSIFSKRLEVVSSSRCRRALSFDNRNGQIQTREALTLQSGSLDNQYGKIVSQRLEIQVFGQFDNRRGVVLAKEGVSVYLTNHFNNTEGQIESEAGMVFIQCKKGQILNRHFACVRSQIGNVVLEAPYILVDETSLVHGKVISKIIAKQKLRQESVLSGEQLLLEADRFDFNSGVISQQQLDIIAGKRKLVLQKPMVSRDRLSISASSLDLQERLWANRSDISVQGRLQYIENSFCIRQALNLTLGESFDFTVPLKIPGNFSLNLLETAKKTINILADIRVGSKQGKAADFVLKMPQSSLKVGRENTHYPTVYASGKLDIEAYDFDLIHGRMVGQQGLSIISTESLSIGRLVPSGTLPSGLLSERKLLLDSRQGEVIIQQAHLQGHSELALCSPKQIDNISGSLKTLGNCLIATPLFKHRVASQTLAGGLRSDIANGSAHQAYKTSGTVEAAMGPPATLTVGKVLTAQGKVEILGSQVHHNGFQGEVPKQTNFIPSVNWTESYLCGHKKVRKCHWIHYQKQSLGTPLLSVFSSGSELQLVSSSLDIAGIVFAPGLQFSAFSQGRIGWQRLDIRLPTPKLFRQSIALEQFITPHPGYVLKESTGVLESVLSSYIQPSSVPITLLCANGSLAGLKSSLICQIPAELQAELIVQILMSEFGRGFLDVLHTTPELIYHKLQENAYEFLVQGEGVAGLDAEKQPIWAARLQQPILVYRKREILDKTFLTPELIFPLSWDNPGLRDWAGGLFSFSHICIEGRGRENSVLTITAHLHSQGKVKFSHLKALNQTKQFYHPMVSYQAVQQRLSCFGLRHKKTIHSCQAWGVEPQSGNTVKSSGVEYEDIASLNLVGVEMDVGSHGIVSQDIGSISEQPLRAKTVDIHRESYPRLFGREERIVASLKEEILPSCIQSQGLVQLSADRADYRSLQLSCEQDIHLSSREHLDLLASKKTVHGPSQMVKRGFIKQRISQSQEQGLPVMLAAMGDITCSSEGTLHSVGTQVSGKNISLMADQGIIQEPLIFNQRTLTKSKGLRGLTVFRSETQEHHESGVSPVLMAEEDIQVQSKKGNVMLIAPLFYAGGMLSLSAPEGDLVIQPAVFHQDMSSRQISIALHFFGSEAIESILQRDCFKASKALLREFPVLRGVGEALRSKDGADKIGHGLKTLYHFHHTLEELAYSKNLKDFVDKQWSLELRARVGQVVRTTQWVELALPWLQAQTILLTAGKVGASGLQAEARNLQISALKEVVLTAAAQSSSEHSYQQGVTFGFQKERILYGGVDFHKEDARALEYLHSHFNVAKQFRIISDGAVSMRGIYVKTLEAVIKAESLILETLQDKYRCLGYGAGVSTAMSGSFTFGRQTRSWASQQSGIEAQEKMLINIRKELILLGTKLQVSGSNPLVAKLPQGESTVFYEYPLVEGFASAYPALPESINLRIWQRSQGGELEVLSVKMIDETLPTLELNYHPETDEHTFLYPKPGLLRAGTILAKDVVDSDIFHRTEGSLDISGISTRKHWVKAIASGDYQCDKASQVNRSTISDDIAIFTCNSALKVNRSISQTRSRDDFHCHYRGFALIGNPKTIAKRMIRPIKHKELLLYKADRYLHGLLEMGKLRETSSKAPKRGTL